MLSAFLGGGEQTAQCSLFSDTTRERHEKGVITVKYLGLIQKLTSHYIIRSPMRNNQIQQVLDDEGECN
jgi:hypothetical protein